MSQWEQIADNKWVKRATVGWVVYVGNNAVYYPPDQKKQAQATYDQAVAEGKYASPPMPAHMGT